MYILFIQVSGQRLFVKIQRELVHKYACVLCCCLCAVCYAAAGPCGMRQGALVVKRHQSQSSRRGEVLENGLLWKLKTCICAWCAFRNTCLSQCLTKHLALISHIVQDFWFWHALVCMPAEGAPPPYPWHPSTLLASDTPLYLHACNPAISLRTHNEPLFPVAYLFQSPEWPLDTLL